MVRLDGFAQSASGFIKDAWPTVVPALQVVFNRASTAFASVVGFPAFNHLHNQHVVVITSVTVVMLLVVKKVISGLSRSDIAKLSEKVIDILNEPTKSLLCRPATSDVETVVPTQTVTPADQANTLALHLKKINADFHVFRDLFDTATHACVTNLEAKEYILKIAEDAVRNKTITYLQLRPYLDLQSIAKKDPNTEEMQQLRYLFLSFEGRFANLYEEDRRVFKSEENIYALWYKSVKASRGGFTAES